MKKPTQLILLFVALALSRCAEFPEVYENVIEGNKIRPFAIVIDPPEAAPGDTVRVELKLYDAEKKYEVDWELGLKYQVNQGATSSGFPTVTEIIDLETGDGKLNPSTDGLAFSVVIPKGSKNPLELTDLSPEVLKIESDITDEEKEELRKLGMTSFENGLKKLDLIGALDSVNTISNKLSPLVDGLVALVQVKAKVSSPGFKLDVTKNLTVRYSNRLESGSYLSNVNRNPVIDSIGFIDVHAAGINHFSKIGSYKADTIFFSTLSESNPIAIHYDTLKVVPGHSYFMIAATRDAEQPYRSPAGETYKEQLFYQWFYTHLDAPESDWEDLITLDNDGRPVDMPVVSVKFPKASVGLKHFAIRATVGDDRPEWGALVAKGLDYKSVFGYLKYE